MFNRKLAALAVLAAITAPSVFAADINTSDGRSGGVFWNQPIVRGAAVVAHEATPYVVGSINPTDGEAGGAFWGNQQALKQASQADERFVATGETTKRGAYSFLEDYNP